MANGNGKRNGKRKPLNGKTNGRAGRPTKFTPDVVEAILKGIAEGLTYRDSCVMAGISEDSFARWRQDNAEFAEQVEQKLIEFKKEQEDTKTYKLKRTKANEQACEILDLLGIGV